MKRITILILSVVLVLSFPLHAFASEPKIVDDAGLLSDNEVHLLEEKTRNLSNSYDMDVVIVTANSLNGKTSEAYADDYFDDNGYGIGSDYSGVLLLLSTEYKDWAISTCAETIYALTDYGVEAVFSEIAPYLANDQYYQAFDVYLDALEPYFIAYHSGAPLDGEVHKYEGPGSYESATQEDILRYPEKNASWYLKKFMISLAIGAVIALIVLLIMRANMNTARRQHGAGTYMRSGSYHLNLHLDLFLYSQVRKVRRQTESSGSSGGSSVHRSSSGRSHGGGHGKF